jgi:lysophospholipase L1-like esterase
MENRVSTAAVSRVRRSAAKVMLVVVALVMSGLVASPSAAASDRGGYLALGDSVAFGYEPPEVVIPGTKYLNPANFKGYPEYFAGVTGLRLTNASCPGESTASMIDINALSYACLNTPAGLSTGYRAMFPLHADYPGQSQLDYAVEYLKRYPDTRLVTLNIGANDVFLCQLLTPENCTAPKEQEKVFGEISGNLFTILKTLRAHYSGPLLVLTYYSESYTDPALVAGTQALNAALAGTAKQFAGVAVADGYTAFKLASSRYNGNPCAAGLLIKLPDGTCNIHPSVRGDWVLTAAVAVARLRASAFQSSAEQLESAVEEQSPSEVPSAVQEESPELQASLT